MTASYKDQLGRSVRQGYVIGGGERKDVSTYDKLGNRLTFITALDAQKGLSFTGKWEYDFAGRAIRSYNAANKHTSVEYDAFGNKTAVTDRMGNTATFTYDAANRLMTKSVPIEGDARSMSKHYYDAAGNVISKKTQRNRPSESASWRQTDFVYNKRNWLTDTIGHGDKGNVCSHTEYDIAGRKTEVYTGLAGAGVMGDGAAVTRYAYGRFGMASMTDPIGYSESYDSAKRDFCFARPTVTAQLRNTFAIRSTGPFPRLLHLAGIRRLAIPRRNIAGTGRFAGRETTP